MRGGVNVSCLLILKRIRRYLHYEGEVGLGNKSGEGRWRMSRATVVTVHALVNSNIARDRHVH